MKIAHRSPVDMISELPADIIEIILTFLPLRDAVRARIVSRQWMYQWENLPQLVFDDSFIPISKEDSRDIVMKIYRILSLHRGSISKFTLDITGLKSCSEIHLSRNGIQDFTLRLPRKEEYELPDYFFSCLKLRHLFLRSCKFKPPPTFKGFSKLISLELREADLPRNLSISNCPLLESLTLQTYTIIDSFSIDAPYLKKFVFIGIINRFCFIKTPLLSNLSLASDDEPIRGEFASDMLNVFGCLPLIEHLFLENRYVEGTCFLGVCLKFWPVYNVPKKIPALLNYLKYLEISPIEFTDLNELSGTLSLIKSSPNLQKLTIQVSKGSNNDVETVLNFLGMQDNSNISLGKLREVELQGDITGLRPELEFIKLLLAKSPALERMRIYRGLDKIDRNDVKILISVAQFRRASQNAEIRFPHLDMYLA